MNSVNFVPKLYGYWRSSASWRVRWAFALKKFNYQYVAVNILAGEPQEPAHLARNALGLLPIFEPLPGVYVAESVAILEWLSETQTDSYRLLPTDPILRAHTRALCELINAETAPLQTPRAQKKHSDDPKARALFAAHFIREGLRGYDGASRLHRGIFSVGDQITVADLFLVPQIYNALRFSIDVRSEFPALWAIYERCMVTPECVAASPEKQSDAVKS